MKVIATKQCGSEYCPHKYEHEHNEFCDGERLTCRWDPDCRCVDVLEQAIAAAISPYIGDDYYLEEAKNKIVTLLRVRGIYPVSRKEAVNG